MGIATQGNSSWNWGATQMVNVTIIANANDTSCCKLYISPTVCLLKVVLLQTSDRDQVGGTNSARVFSKNSSSDGKSSPYFLDLVELTNL